MTTECRTSPVRGAPLPRNTEDPEPRQQNQTPEPDPGLMGQRRFRAMNTDVTFYVRALEDVAPLAAAEDLFHTLEARLSRFLPDSELSLLNECSGQTVAVSKTMLDILQRARQLHRDTGGVFEPAILPHLETAGYDRSFEQVAPAADALPQSDPDAVFSITQLEIDAIARTVTAPAGLRIDLGGIGKGYAVDAAARMLRPAFDFVVSAGGDMFASGCGPDGDGWLASIVDPFGSDEPISLVRLHNQALATSTTARRRWQRGGQLRHHLIDPATRRPSENGIILASVIAPTATEADVFAKTALLLGPERGCAFLAGRSAEGVFVGDDGAVTYTDGWPGTRRDEEVAL